MRALTKAFGMGLITAVLPACAQYVDAGGGAGLSTSALQDASIIDGGPGVKADSYVGDVFVEQLSVLPPRLLIGFGKAVFAPQGDTVASLPTTNGTCQAYGTTDRQSSAGDITLDDGSSRLGTMLFAGGGPTPVYTELSGSRMSWSPGDSLAVAAAGDLVDGFSVGLVAPFPVADLELDGAAINVDTQLSLSQAHVLTWTPGDGSAVMISVTQQGPGTIACRAGDTGQFTIPVSALTGVSSASTSGLAPGPASLVVARFNQTTMSPRNASVTYEIGAGVTAGVALTP